MMLRKQVQEPSAAAAALASLNAKMDGWRAELRATTNRVVELEQSGVEATEERAGYNADRAAIERLNGDAYRSAPAGINLGAELFQLRREAQTLRKTLDLAEKQWEAASVDVGRELLQRHAPEINALHRRRALAILEIFKCSGELEAMRLRLLQSGSSIAHELDGYSLRLWGELMPPSPMNHWPRKYLSECLKAGIISDRDLELSPAKFSPPRKRPLALAHGLPTPPTSHGGKNATNWG